MSNSILLAPGPVQLHPEVQKILSEPMIHHRTPVFDEHLKKALARLKLVFKTEQPCYMLSSTGTGGMEAILVNVLNPKDKVLAIISGKFGERWADMAQTFGAEVIRLNCPWGQAIELNDIKMAFQNHPDIKIVMTQACETSTATSHPIKEIGQLIKSTDALFLVDGITALGAYELPMDDWFIDGLVGGSQKAFMLPTGMSFLSFSKKAWLKIQKNQTTPRFYFDIQKEHQANQKGETYFSSNVQIIRALNCVLDQIESHGLQKLHQDISSRTHYTRAMANHLKLNLYSSAPSLSVTALNLPESIDGVKFRDHVEKKYNLIVMGGQDQLKGKIIRIGHMGYITKDDLHQSTLRLASALNDFGHVVDSKTIEHLSLDYLAHTFSDKE